MSDLADLQQRALANKARYDEHNQQQGEGKWEAKDYAAGFVGDVGDLMKLVMAKDGKRKTEDVDAKLAHELSDCLWSLLILANEYSIDLDASFRKTMSELEERLNT